MKTQTIHKFVLVVAALAMPMLANAAQVSLNAGDAAGSSSYNAVGHWNNGQAPGPGNDYFTAGFLLRTPNASADGANYVFGGDSLTLGPTAGTAGSMIEKFGGVGGQVRTETINNLTNLAGAMIRSGAAPATQVHIAGNHFTIAGNSTILGDQSVFIIDSPLLGADNVFLTNSCASFDHVEFNGTNSGFTGTLVLSAPPSGWWNLQLNNVNSLPGNPSTPNPGQILFYANGELHDIVGCSYTNSNGGITLAGNGVINASATTLIGVPITDLTNGVHSVSSLISSGSGTLILSNANNTYSGGTVISAGVVQMGMVNALPANTIAGDVTNNATLDLNGYDTTINGLNGSGTVDTVAGGTPTLTIGANGDNGDFSGVIQNSSGTLSLTKNGAGTQTLSGGYTYRGATVVAGGTLSLITSANLPATAGSLTVSNGGNLAVDASSGNALPASSVDVDINGSVTLTLNPAYNGINASGNLTFQDNATNNFNYGTLTVNPAAAAINVAGGISAPGSNIVINITAIGLRPGTFTLIKYNTGTLASIANFQVSPPPGVAATLVNNTGNRSIDLHISSIPNQLVWNGVSGANWDLVTPNWMSNGVITVFRQYTNGSVVAGDSVLFDDTLTNDFVHPQPTNINLTGQFYAYPVVVNSTLPYSIGGAGGIVGVTSLVKSSSGSLTLLTSNSFTGGVFINDSGSVIITNDSALGASSGAVTLNGGTLQINGAVTNSRAFSIPADSTIGVATNVTANLKGSISGTGGVNRSDNGTLILTARETFAGNLFLHGGFTVIDSGGSITNATWDDVGQNGTDTATLTLKGTGSLLTTSDFNVGDVDNSSGTLNIQDSATLTANQLFVGSANADGSTAGGTVNQNGGTVTEISTAVGAFAIGGRTSASGIGVYNMNSGTLTANAGIRVGGTGIGTLNQNGGLINALQGINIARIAGSFGTNNLNGGVLSTYNVTSSTGTNAVFNFNGGTLQANFNPGSPWFSAGIQANILAGGAFIDSSNNNVAVNAPLLAGSPNGGLTKKGAGTLTLAGTNTFTGPITNTAGTLVLNAPSTYSGLTVVNAGNVQVTSASSLAGGATINNGGVLTIAQGGAITENMGNMTLNGAAGTPGATLALAPTNTSAALVNCGTLTLNGTNSISLPIQNPGTLALIHYTSLAGSGNCTNLALPQGAGGYISNNAPSSTIYAVITSTGPGIVWSGTNTAPGKVNLWDINTTTNWLLGVIPTSYHQIVVPGDLVTFNDAGSGTVLLSNNVGPTSITISNTAKTYTFSGNGSISGPTGILKLGTNVAILALTNNTYTGNTVISNGTLQVGASNAVSPSVNVVLGPSGVLDVAGFNVSLTSELTGNGAVVDNNGNDAILTVGSSAGGTWNGNIQYTGHGGVALAKNGSGTWFVGGSNYLANGQSFQVQNIFNGGTTVITNAGSVISPVLQTWIGNGAGNSATVVVAGGTLAANADNLIIGNGTATGTLIVNNGTVIHGGNLLNAFNNANNLVVGSGGVGTLTVNGGQVLNSQALRLGQNSGGSGTLYLNGGLVQASQVTANNSPDTSIAYFNGGILQAVSNSADFIVSGTTPLIQSGGLILDDGGNAVSISSQGLQEDPMSTGGGLIKQGNGALYLDAANSYMGATLVTNGLLAGIGSVAGNVVVGPAGNLGAGDEGTSIGTFTMGGNLTLAGMATLRVNKDASANDRITFSGVGNVTYGGTLVVSNLSTTALTTNDTFTLFSGFRSYSGNFSGIVGSPGAGLRYQFTPASGVLSIVAGPLTNPPPAIKANFSGNTLTLGWNPDYLGYILQVQTNSASKGLSTNWVNVTGSDSTTNAVITVNPTNQTVFYRLVYP